jgi:putative inorganic carbon (HCO3(-)) transporter
MESHYSSVELEANELAPSAQWDPEDANVPEPAAPQEKRWDLAFFGVMLYVLVEYSRLPAMYPILGVLHLGKVAVISGLLGYLMSGQSGNQVRRSIRHIDVTFIWLLAAAFLSSLIAEFRELAFSGWLDGIVWFAIYLMLSRVVSTSWRLQLVILLFLLLNLKLGQFVIRGYAQGSASATDQVVFVSNGVGAGSTGFFANSADLGVAMCVAWPIAIALLFARPKFLTRMVAWASTFACLGAILLCGSRGAVVGAAAIALGAWVKTPKKLIALFMVILVAAGIYLVLPEASKKRFEAAQDPESDKTAHHRLELWKAGLRMFGDHPIFGVGLNNYRWVRYYHYPIPVMGWIPSVPHSSYIQGLSELGLVGFPPLIVLWISYFRLNKKTRKILTRAGPEERRSYEYCLSVGLDLAMIGFMVSGAFVSVLWYPHIFVLLGLGAALHQIAQAKQMTLGAGAELEPAREVA